MKILFTAGGTQSIVFGVAPLATAARNAGHEILLVIHEPATKTAEVLGLPAVTIKPEPIRGQRFTGASARLDALQGLAEDWPPDLVIGGLSHVPGVLATRLKVPYVRQAWVPMAEKDRTDKEELQPDVERLGLTELPPPALFIDVTPPSLRPSHDADLQPMRWIPNNRQRPIEQWMYTRPMSRRRVLITSGTRTILRDPADSSMRHLVDQLTLAGAEVLIAAPEGADETCIADLSAELGAPQLGDARIDWIPLDVVAPTCDLAVHLGAAVTAMTFINAGVPQLIIPGNRYGEAVAQALSGFGAALTVTPQQEPEQDPAEVIAAGCREMLSSPGYAQRARALATEISTLPTPPDVIHTLATLAAA